MKVRLEDDVAKEVKHQAVELGLVPFATGAKKTKVINQVLRFALRALRKEQGQ